jgi:hypothetical protein
MGFGRGRGRGRGGDDCCCGLSTSMCMVASFAGVAIIVTISVLIGGAFALNSDRHLCAQKHEYMMCCAVSVKSLETNEVGLDYDGFNMQLNSKLYEGGTYFLGLAHSFLAYPKTQQVLKARQCYVVRMLYYSYKRADHQIYQPCSGYRHSLHSNFCWL